MSTVGQLRVYSMSSSLREQTLSGTLPIVMTKRKMQVWWALHWLSELLLISDHIVSTHISCITCELIATGPLTLSPRAWQACSLRTGITGKATGFISLGRNFHCHVYPSAKSRAKHMLSADRQIWKRVDNGANLLNAWSGERADKGQAKNGIFHLITGSILKGSISLFFWVIIDVI